MAAEATLVVGPSWVGDMIMAQSLFEVLRARDPGRPVDVLAPGWSLPVVARMPQVRNGIDAETGHGELALGRRRRLGVSLRDRYDRAIVLPRSFKAALVPWFARIPRRTGFRGELRYGLINDMREFDPAILDQTVKRFVALGLDAGETPGDVPFPALDTDRVNQRAVTERLGLATDRPVVAMMPGAEYGPAKCWPLEYFASLATQLAERGYAIWILGSEKDRPAGVEIAAQCDAANLCGKTSLEDAIDLLALSVHAVSNDSGLMHMAAAVGTRVHALYGSSTPDFTPPLTERREIHWLNIDCSPCFERHCPLGHFRCMREMGPERILEGIMRQEEDIGDA